MSIKAVSLTCFEEEYNANAQIRTPNQLVMFCNGIHNTEREARDSAKLISQACFNIKVIVVHNPTTLLDFIAWNSSVSSQKDHEENFSLALALKISELIDGNKHRILIFAHSHGTFLTKRALELLEDTGQHKLVDVVGFGGITMIPKKLGGSVSNWIFHTDALAIHGNKCRQTDNPEGFKAFTNAMKMFAYSYTPIQDRTEISELFEAGQSFDFAQHHIMILPGKLLPHDLSNTEQWLLDLQAVVPYNHFFKTYVDFFRNYVDQMISSQREQPFSIFSHILLNFGSGFMSTQFPNLRQNDDNSLAGFRVGEALFMGTVTAVTALVVGCIFKAYFG